MDISVAEELSEEPRTTTHYVAASVGVACTPKKAGFLAIQNLLCLPVAYYIEQPKIKQFEILPALGLLDPYDIRFVRVAAVEKLATAFNKNAKVKIYSVIAPRRMDARSDAKATEIWKMTSTSNRKVQKMCICPGIEFRSHGSVGTLNKPVRETKSDRTDKHSKAMGDLRRSSKVDVGTSFLDEERLARKIDVHVGKETLASLPPGIKNEDLLNGLTSPTCRKGVWDARAVELLKEAQRELGTSQVKLEKGNGSTEERGKVSRSTEAFYEEENICINRKITGIMATDGDGQYATSEQAQHLLSPILSPKYLDKVTAQANKSSGSSRNFATQTADENTTSQSSPWMQLLPILALAALLLAYMILN
uniref:Uncharacterized protein n=1 Tax=Trichuris muris TaxID=70415 RepID=A0A5S6QR06_TRIMR